MNHIELCEVVTRVAGNNNVTMVMNPDTEFFRMVPRLNAEEAVDVYNGMAVKLEPLKKLVATGFPDYATGPHWGAFKSALFLADDLVNTAKPTPQTICHLTNALIAMVVASGKERQILVWTDKVSDDKDKDPNPVGVIELAMPEFHEYILQSFHWAKEIAENK